MDKRLVTEVMGDVGELEKEILNQIPTPVMAVNKAYEIVYINESAVKKLKKTREEVIGQKCAKIFNSKHCGTEECCMIKAMKEGTSNSCRNEILFDGLKTPVEYHAVPLKDGANNIVGGLEFIVDITEQVKHEERLIEQSKTIRQMSTPTIKLWEGVLVLPVVGVVDSMRAQFMMESILNKIVDTASKVIILDIQGVAAVDTAVANHLIKITKATRLMGCQCILSGISSSVAQTIIRQEIDMQGINTKATLSDALEETFALLGLEVRAKKEL